jgi:phosphodiester glycosidase
MSLRCKRRGLRAVLTACAVTVGVLAGTSQLASAFVPCPRTGSRVLPTLTWETSWPTEARVNPKGVTLCRGAIGGTTPAYLQMVDLGDGAKIRLHADVDPESPPASFSEPNTLYRKRVASEWYSWIRSLPNTEQYQPYLEPDDSRLFSITNATFFTDIRNENQTTLPFPLMTWALTETLGLSFRRAFPRYPQEEELIEPEEARADEDYEAPKKALLIDAEFWEGSQQVRIQRFASRYEFETINEWFENIETFYPADAAVSFPPEYRIGELHRRTYVGVWGDTVYIFVTQASMTNADASAMMQEIQPGMEVIQMDGGASTQFYSRYGAVASSASPAQEVPNVLAVYTAP